MKVQIICGFLGVGKTTLLKNILQNKASDTAVLVNEFGELGIDGTLISEGTSMDVIELPSGCICCSLRDELTKVVEKIMVDLNPSQLIIEPSGIASPSQIILGLKKADFWDQLELEPVIGIIDCGIFLEMVEEDVLGNFFQDQILNSDIILLNKADLVSQDTLEKCKETVFGINPTALTIPSVYCQVEIPNVKANQDVKHLHFAMDFKSEVISFTGEISVEKLTILLEQLSSNSYGWIFRGKGLINTETGLKSFDYVNGIIDFKDLTVTSENKFVFIGRNISKEKLMIALSEVIQDGP